MSSEEIRNSADAVETPGKRKYATYAQARRAGAYMWRDESWPQNLYRNCEHGRFAYRSQRPGAPRSFRTLKSDNYKVAKRKLEDVMKEITTLRDTGQNSTSGDFRTLGALATEFRSTLTRSDRKDRTNRAHGNCVERLRRHWLIGNFDTFLARKTLPCRSS